MATSATYAGPLRNTATHFPLVQFRVTDGNARATLAAVNQVGKVSTVYGISDKGILGEDGRPMGNPPYILLRGSNKQVDYLKAKKMFLADKELATLSDFYGPPPEQLKGAYFVLEKGANFHRVDLSIIPSFFELLDPQWRGEYLDWLRHPAGKVPEPGRFTWNVLAPGLITMPALDNSLTFTWKVTNPSGTIEMELYRSVNDDARAVLTGRWEKPEHFDLSPAGFYVIGASTMGKETLDARKLGKLLLGEKGYETLQFSHQASAYEAKYHYIKIAGASKENLMIHSRKAFRIEAGGDYYFAFARLSDLVILHCYADAARQKLLGTASINAGDHYFLEPNFNLEPML
jgi:hypothetical protein